MGLGQLASVYNPLRFTMFDLLCSGTVSDDEDLKRPLCTCLPLTWACMYARRVTADRLSGSVALANHGPLNLISCCTSL